MNYSWCARHRVRILAGPFLIPFALFITSIVMQSTAVNIVTIIALFVFRAIGKNRFSEVVRWRILVGLVFGFFGRTIVFDIALDEEGM